MKKLLFPLIAGTLILLSCNNKTTSTNFSKVKITTGMDSLSYAFGIQLASYLIDEMGENFEVEAVAKAVSDVNNQEAFMTTEEANVFINSYMQKLQKIVAEKNLKAGQAFLQENAKKEGITELPSGVQYEVIKQGDGALPLPEDIVKFHYKGSLIDGTVFQSSQEKGPIEYAVNKLIPGWTEVLQLMPVGSKWKIYLPSEQAYGSQPMPGSKIKPNSALIFEIELLDIIAPDTTDGK